MSRERVLAETFVELADTWVDEFDVLDFLHNLTARSVQLLGSDAAAIVLGDQRGELRIVSSTTQSVTELEVVTLANREGPCLDAVRSGEPVISGVVEETTRARWPAFTRAALEAGLSGVHAFPMRVRSDVIGAMCLVWRSPPALGEDDVAIASALTSVATMSLLHERTTRQREVLAAQLHSTLNDLVVVEQAKGVVAEVLSIDVSGALSLMTAHSRSTRVPLTEVARDLLDRPIGAMELRGDA